MTAPVSGDTCFSYLDMPASASAIAERHEVHSGIFPKRYRTTGYMTLAVDEEVLFEDYLKPASYSDEGDIQLNIPGACTFARVQVRSTLEEVALAGCSHAY